MRFRKENGEFYPLGISVKLGEIAEVKGGVGFPVKLQKEDTMEIPFFKVSDMNIQGNERELKISNNYVSQDTLESKLRCKVFNPPGIVFAKVGAALLLDRKRLCYQKFLVDNNMMAVTVNSKNCVTEYLYYYLVNFNLSSLSQVGALPSINAKQVKDINIILPCKDEQEKIASFFSTLDEKISLVEDKLTLINKLKKGIIQKILSQEVRFRDEKGCVFPDWINKKMGDIFSISAGGDLDKSRASNYFDKTFCYKVFANALPGDGLYGYANYYLIEGDTITVTGRGDIGHAIARHEKYVPIVRLLVCKPLKQQNVDFFAEIINNTKIFNESTGVPQLTRPQLAEIKVPVPTLDEQDKIAKLVKSLDDLIKTNRNKINQLRRLRQGLIKEMFA